MDRVFKNIKLPNYDRETEIRMECFENGGEILAKCMNRPMNPEFSKNNFDPNHRCDKEWTGVADIMEAKKMLDDGWTEKVDVVKDATRQIERQMTSLKVSGLKSDVVGFVPIVPNAIMGLPNSMLNSDVKPKKNKVINLIYGLSYSSSVDMKEIIDMGLKVMKRVLKLEAMGYRVRLSCLQNYSDNKRLVHVMSVKVKSEDQPLDAQRVMFPMFHPAMFRVIGFGWYETLPESTYFSGYGSPLYYHMSEEQIDSMMEQLFGRTAVYIDGTFLYKEGDEYLDRRLGGMVQ